MRRAHLPRDAPRAAGAGKKGGIPRASEVVLRDVRALLPSDESVNGTWSLVIEDSGGGLPAPGSALVFGIELEVATWFD